MSEETPLYVQDILAGVSETLHPDLEPYLFEVEPIGKVLKHPLVFQVPYFQAGYANQSYLLKTRAVEEARREGNWHTYVMLHERPYRFDALSQAAEAMLQPPVDWEAYWELVRYVWIDSENPYENYEGWQAVLCVDGCEHMMTEDERDHLAGLPEEIVVYRGAVKGLNEEGLSWTLDRARALWFARRFAHRGQGVLVVGKVRREDVVAYLGSRHEEEIIALPEDVEVVRVGTVS